MWCFYLAADSVCESLYDIQSVFYSRKSTDKHVAVTVISTVSSTYSFLQILRLLQRSCLPLPPAKYCLMYFIAIVKLFMKTDFDYGSHRLPEFEFGLKVGVTSRQEKLTPLWHVILLLMFPGPHVTRLSNSDCSIYQIRTCLFWKHYFPVYLKRRIGFDAYCFV
jgi:hypothetical protein